MNLSPPTPTSQKEESIRACTQWMNTSTCMHTQTHTHTPIFSLRLNFSTSIWDFPTATEDHWQTTSRLAILVSNSIWHGTEAMCFKSLGWKVIIDKYIIFLFIPIVLRIQASHHSAWGVLMWLKAYKRVLIGRSASTILFCLGPSHIWNKLDIVNGLNLVELFCQDLL